MSITLRIEELKKYSKEELLLIIREYINEQKDLSYRKMIADESFNKAGWSETQAHHLGIQKLATKILNFLPDQENINV